MELGSLLSRCPSPAWPPPYHSSSMCMPLRAPRSSSPFVYFSLIQLISALPGPQKCLQQNPPCCTSQQNPSWSRPAADTLKSISWGSHSSWHRTTCTGLPLTPRGQPPSALKLLLAASPQDSPRGAPHPNTAGFLLVTGALRICITFQSGFVFSLPYPLGTDVLLLKDGDYRGSKAQLQV